MATADANVVTAQTELKGAQEAAENAVTEASRLMSGCLCRVHKEQTKACAAATTAHASHAADWKQTHEILCALDSASTTCNVPTCPAVTKPNVAAGVENADQNHCTAAPTQSPTNAPTRPPCSCRCKHPLAAAGVAGDQEVCYTDQQWPRASQGYGANWMQKNDCTGYGYDASQKQVLTVLGCVCVNFICARGLRQSNGPVES